LDLAGRELRADAWLRRALAQLRLEHFVDGYAESLSTVGDHEECPVFYSDYSQVLHVGRLQRSIIPLRMPRFERCIRE
jgi:hypothetical protein